MTIGRKMLMLLLLFGAVLLTCVYELADYFLLRNVRRTEKMEVGLQLERARRVFDAEAASLSGFVEDWSAWDDTCRFLVDTNREYIASNLPEEFFAKNRVHLALFINNQGDVVYGRHDNRKAPGGVEWLGGALDGNKGFEWLGGVKTVTSGVAVLPGGLALLAAAPVLTSRYSGPAQGLLVMARYLDTPEQVHLSRLYGVTLHVCEGAKNRGVESVCPGCQPDLDVSLHLATINGAEPAKVLIRIPHRVGHNHVLTDRYIMFGSLVVLYGLVCGFAAFVVRWTVLGRLKSLAEFVRSIKPDECRVERLNLGGSDELTLLAEAVNRMVEDMARAQALEKKLREAQKMQALGNLAVGIAHDFNNMLYAITGYITMLKPRVKEDPVSGEYLERVAKAVELSSGLVRQLMAFGRSDEQGAFRFSLSSVIRESLVLFQASLPSTITVQLKLGAGLDMVLADPSQIYQMMMNLYLNAFHSMREKGGVITVTTGLRAPQVVKDAGLPHEAGATWLCLSVADTGCGIPESDLGRVFEPYFTTKPVEDGSGLGLSVVRHIVESAGGVIQVASKVGEGSVFSVYFPLAGDAVGHQPSAVQVERSHESSSMPNT